MKVGIINDFKYADNIFPASEVQPIVNLSLLKDIEVKLGPG